MCAESLAERVEGAGDVLKWLVGCVSFHLGGGAGVEVGWTGVVLSSGGGMRCTAPLQHGSAGRGCAWSVDESLTVTTVTWLNQITA